METDERTLKHCYRANERTIKARTRYYARKWHISPDDISGDAREAFINAVRDYEPSFGTSVKTVIVTYVNTALNNAANKIKCLQARFVPQSHMSSRHDKKYDSSCMPDGCIENLVDWDLCTMQRHIQISSSEEKELMDLINNNLDKHGKTLLHTRLCGYTTADSIKAKLLTRHQAVKATNDLRAFALREFPNCVR